MTGIAKTVPLYSSRPRITIDGQRDARLDAGVLSLSVKEDEDGLYRCEISFGNWGSKNGKTDYLYFDRQVFDFGRLIKVEMGDGNAAAQVFLGHITAIEGRFIEQRPPEIQILAEDRLQDLRMVRRTRTFEHSNVNDIAQAIADDHGLELEIDIESPSYDLLSQLNQSDLAFLREKARLIDAQVWVEDNRLYMQSRARRKVAELDLVYKKHLHEFMACADLAHQRTQLSVSGWDVSAKEKLQVNVDQSILKSELQDGIGGAQVLQDAFGPRQDSITHLSPSSNEETQRLAESHYRAISRKFVTGEGLAEGDARLKAGAKVNISGVGSMFNGAYYVSSAHHMFSADCGYKTKFAVERPIIGAS